MNNLDAELESFWDNLLSGEKERVLAAFRSLDEGSQQETLRHLQRMVTEEGWHPLQRQSAQAALDILADL